jgi:hypothetical protein
VVRVILNGSIDFGLIIAGTLSAQHAVENASRRAAIEPVPDDIIAGIGGPGFLEEISYKVCFINEDGDARNGDVGDSVRVEGHYESPLPIPYVGFPIDVYAVKRLETRADATGYEANPDGTCP